MKGKFLLAALVVGAFISYLSGCAKENGDRLGAGTSCDTTNVKYSTQIVSILRDNCYSCHQGPGASSGFDLSNYEAFSGWAQSGYVIGDITHAAGFTPMPYGLPMLSTCEINTILAWINQGTPNN